jgi:hypothetical protein
MFMRYWGGGIGHQDEGERWKLADRGIEEHEMDVNSESDDEQHHPQQASGDLTQLGHLNEVAAHLKADENAGAETDNSCSSHSSNSISSTENPWDHGTDDDEDDCMYFGPEDGEQMLDHDSDG